MVSYICDKCNKIFGHKVDYTRHVNRKRPCKSDKVNESDIKLIAKGQQKITEEQQKITEEQQKITGNKLNCNNKQCRYCLKHLQGHIV